jgi:3-hydroxyacyl-CoA dehydrogenase/enoyl-CoA hydratase/3-hydroxybutyryl-CoA epimerase
MAAYTHWRLDKDADSLAWLTLDKQGASTNTLSIDVLEELARVLEDVDAQKPRGLIIRSGKPGGFIAGADIEEFLDIANGEDAKRMVRRGWDPFNKLERFAFPSVALIDGFCMGGGLELALACRYRIAVDQPGTRLALPEVLLGIWPLMGGVMRLPRLVSPPQALDLMLTGRSVDARRARRMGLVDAAVPVRVAQNAARLTALRPPAPRRLPLLASLMNMPALRRLVAGAARKQVARRVRREHYPAPYAVIDAWQNYNGDPFRIPDTDPASIVALIEGPTARNLIRVFFLQERLKSLGKQASFDARRVHVVGAGVMGGDIAAVCALRGMRVTLQDQSAERLVPAMKRAAALFQRRLREPLRVRDALDRLIPDSYGHGARHADVVIEAIFEDLGAKQALFTKLEAEAKTDAILASNTSSLKLSDIAAPMRNPSRLVGIHFFNPVAQMQLVEVVSGAVTDRGVASRAAVFVRAIDKLPLPVKDSPGFLVNRVLGPYLLQALRLVDEGRPPETIDATMEAFGMPMGPIELADVVGLDICLAVGRELAGAAAPPEKLARLVKEGQLGKKSERGFYVWRNGKAQKRQPGTPDAALEEQLIEPYLRAAREALADGIVADADLVDAGLIFGTGFAPFRGGPLNYLDTRATKAA